MPINRAEFKNAFREVVSAEFSHIPTDESSIGYTFSHKFEKKMQKLINAQKKSYWGLINTASKRAAIIFVALLTLFTATFSVKAIREPVVNFLKQICEKFVYYKFEGDTALSITKEYIITQLPDGFIKTNEIRNEAIISKEYANSSGDIIEFSQMITGNETGYFVDNEHGNLTTEVVNNIEVEFKEWYNTKTAIWIKDEYVFTINCYGNINFDTIKQMIKSIG